VPLNSYPDLIENPSNPYAKMRDMERLKDFIDACARIWAETLRERIEAGKMKNQGAAEVKNGLHI